MRISSKNNRRSPRWPHILIKHFQENSHRELADIINRLDERTKTIVLDLREPTWRHFGRGCSSRKLVFEKRCHSHDGQHRTFDEQGLFGNG